MKVMLLRIVLNLVSRMVNTKHSLQLWHGRSGAHWRAFQEQLNAGNADTAFTELNAAIEASPGNPDLLIAGARLLHFRLGEYNAVKADLQSVIEDGPRYLRLQACRLLVKYVWEREGTAPELIEIVRRVGVKIETSRHHLVRYAALLNEAGRPLEALDVVERACNKSPTLVDHIGFLDLLRVIDLHSKLRPRRGSLASRLSEWLDESEGSFLELVRKNDDQYCIVGNSPNAVGLGAGIVIDKSPLVIRCNNYPSGYPWEADYGRRTDVWVRPGFTEAVPYRPLKNLGHLVLCGNNLRHRSSDGLDLVLPYFDAGLNVEVIPSIVYRELFAKLDAVPSTGSVMLWWIHRVSGPIPVSRIFGFSLNDNSRYASRYPTGEVRGTKPSRHDWDAERRLFDTVVRSNGSAG